MLRSILVGLDGSEHGESALNYAIPLAKRMNAMLVGMGCIDEPGIHGPEEYLVGEPYFDRVNANVLSELRTKVEGTLSRCALRCAEEGVAFKPLEDVGTPYVRILMEAQRYDLIVLAHRTHFQFGWEDTPDETLSRVLAESPRPVMVVPDHSAMADAVLVAYDGSLQAAHTLYAFQASGLGKGRVIHVLSVADRSADAARRAERAVEFLKSHELDVKPIVVGSSEKPASVLLEQTRQLGAGLVVMGAYGQPVLREFFLGSTTKLMLDKCPVPLFLSH